MSRGGLTSACSSNFVRVLGRVGTLAGCWLNQLGLEGGPAIALVRDHRSARAIEAKEQETVVREFLRN